MPSSDEALWARVEHLADEMNRMPPDRIPHRLSELASSGEAPTVLTLLGTWLSLPPPPAGLSAGTLLGGRYLLKEKLGEGGMGVVWRAGQEFIARDVAVKIIHPALVTPALQTRFVSEMKVLGQLNHPGIVKIFDAGVHHLAGSGQIPFFAMEFIEGEPLDEWARPRRNQVLELLRVVREICAALGTAHEREIVHRDLKPKNILVRPSGQPVVVDFGIARLRGLSLREEEGIFSGTPQYAAPEQHLGRDHDFRSGESVDIYALGAILFEVLVGRKLFPFDRGCSVAEMRRIILESPVTRLSNVLPDCPPALDELVSRAVRREPVDRFYSMGGLARAIDRVASLLQPSAPPPCWSPAPRATIPGTAWTLTEKIGEGGAGEVWIGLHNTLGERRVFKFCDTDEKARTLKREVTLFRLLKERVGRNPHFITLHEVSLDEPPFYLMMEYVEARELDAWCTAQPGGLKALPESTRLEIVIQTAEALQAAHEAGILHRDVKPANLLVRSETHGLHVFVADFGLGQIVTDQLLVQATRLGFTRTLSEFRADRLSGTLLYLAPEVLQGAPATARSDIYSLGVVLWQLLTGNLHVALDPSDWSDSIADPNLREDLRRCLAGVPERRWASAGELAARLRALPHRRASEARQFQEMKARERAAYRRGIFRTAIAAAAVIAILAFLAIAAFVQRASARRSEAELARDQAEALSRFDLEAGRRLRGLALLEKAARAGTNRAAIRTAAASVFALSDLAQQPYSASSSTLPKSSVPTQAGEVLRTFSSNANLLAVARDLDGLSGAVDLYEAVAGQKLATFTRKDFPWVPIAERGLLVFSRENNLLAVGGAATSRHILVFDCTNYTLRSYIFHGSDPLSCAWHPSNQLLASGCADGSIRIWDINTAISPRLRAGATNQFDLPPLLDVPALDVPLYQLEGQLGPVEHLSFSSDGQWLAALDQAGYLRVFTGFPTAVRARSPQRTPGDSAEQPALAPLLALQTKLHRSEPVTGISTTGSELIVTYATGLPEKFTFSRTSFPEEAPATPDLVDLAWNEYGSELCIVTPTDTHWFITSPLERFFFHKGNNPVRVGWDARTRSWLLPGNDRLYSVQTVQTNGNWRVVLQSSFPLEEAEKGQGAVTSAATAHDGRTATYRGRRIQFAFNHAQATNSLIIADTRDTQFQNLFWDTSGKLLSAVFAKTNGALLLHCWGTSADFPPNCTRFKPITLDIDTVVPVNDGRHIVGHSSRNGLLLFDPSSGTRQSLPSPGPARHNAPMDCTADGRLLAIVVDPNVVRLLQLPSGNRFADLPKTTGRSSITALRWDRSGSRLAALTEDGRVAVWNFAEWHQWILAHDLND